MFDKKSSAHAKIICKLKSENAASKMKLIIYKLLGPSVFYQFKKMGELSGKF